MNELKIKELYITPRICISVANEWLVGYERDEYGRSWYVGFVALTLFNDEDYEISLRE